MAYLKLMLEGREVRKFVLNRGVTTVGRAQDNDIVINNLALSRRHAQLTFVDDGGYEVSDLKSQNGVYVNHERIRGHRLLDDRDTITLGTYNFVFRRSEEEEDDDESERQPPRRNSSTQSELHHEGYEPEEDEEPEEEEYDAEDDDVPLLVLTYNDVELQRFPIRVDSCLVGRAKECHVQIPERRLSRKHCQVVRNEDERYFVKDLGSQNGTYVNRRRIRGFHELSPGDVLNFAEYSVSFLADGAAYDGPDSQDYDEDYDPPAPVPSDPEIAGEETVMPQAYSDEFGYDADSAVHPVDYDDEDEPKTPAPPVALPLRKVKKPQVQDLDVGADPVVERPREARARRDKAPPARSIREKNRTSRERRTEDDEPERGKAKRREAPPQRRRRQEPERHEPERHEPERHEPERHEPEIEVSPPPRPKRKKKKASKKPAKAQAPMHEELEDDFPDPGELDDWYSSRDDKSALYEPLEADPEEEDDFDADSGLVRREPSSVSAVLSTMMVDKRELDRNLKKKKKTKTHARAFSVEVKHGDDVIFEGSLDEDVTILGTDREADIPLRGRYVAGRHSLLVRVRDSLLLVRLGSSSAARVNGLPKLQAFLKSGDVIQIDETTIEITEG